MLLLEMNAKKTGVSDELLKLLEDEVKISTIFGLYLFDTLNLKHISRIIHKGESTTLRHLKTLIGQKVIEIDMEKSAQSWGKYYRLTSTFKLKLELMFSDSPIEWDKKDSYDKLASGVRAFSSLIHAVGKFTASYLDEKKSRKFMDADEEGEDYTMSRFSMSISLPSINSKSDAEELRGIIREFTEKIDDFDRKNKIQSSENQILYLFTAPLDEIHPLKRND
jgi:hypothetical protein